MGKSRYGRGWGAGDWTRIEVKMFRSRAYASLTGAAKMMLNELLAKRRLVFPKDKKGGRGAMQVPNIGELTLTYKELESIYGFTKQTISNGFRDLLAKGFIEVVDPGGAYEKHKAIYALVDDYLKWCKGDPPIRKRQKDTKRGWQKGKPPQLKQTIPTHTQADNAHPPKGTLKEAIPTPAVVRVDERAELSVTYSENPEQDVRV